MSTPELEPAFEQRFTTKNIESFLLEHPDVKDARVIAESDQLEAYVVADLTRIKESLPGEARLTDMGLVDRWNTLYDVTYSKGAQAPSFVGWTSSYTRQPIPET